ncbi:MAG TPA: FkbM family methyltransferase, partial [Acidimicrobiales bacterium]|nr:FkbM family methyltransferase [Acidimicrobiales bacterium]
MTATSKVVLRTPFDDHTFAMTGSARDASTVRMIERAGGLYEPAVMTVLSKLLPPDAVVVDVGANIGALSVVLAHLAPAGHICALEPAAESFGFLEENLAANGAANVTAERLALYDVNGTTVLHYPEAFAAGAFVSEVVDEGVSEEVETARLDDWVERRRLDRLDLVKLDVEGAESRVLHGGRATIERFRPHLLVEFNPVVLRRFQQQRPRALYRLLTSLYPRVLAVEEGGTVAPVLGWDHLRAKLHGRGVIDLLATFATGAEAGRLALPPRRSGVADYVRGRLEYNRLSPPRSSMIPEPACELAVEPPGARPAAGQPTTLAVTVRNTSRTWYSSGFERYPVFLSYRWLGADGGVVAEGPFQTVPALRPGTGTTVPLPVEAPAGGDAAVLVISLVQQDVMWFYEVDPAMGW